MIKTIAKSKWPNTQWLYREVQVKTEKQGNHSEDEIDQNYTIVSPTKYGVFDESLRLLGDISRTTKTTCEGAGLCYSGIMLQSTYLKDWTLIIALQNRYLFLFSVLSRQLDSISDYAHDNQLYWAGRNMESVKEILNTEFVTGTWLIYRYL